MAHINDKPMFEAAKLARAIDHALLKPDMTDVELMAGLDLARAFGVATVCCRPADVEIAAGHLAGSIVAVGTVIGFPHGAHTTDTKVFEATEALRNGAVELDMVINIGQLRSGHLDAVERDIAAVVDAVAGKAIVKVILETVYLSDQQKREACRAAAEAGAQFVKTSTGFAGGGATVADVRLMREASPAHMQVKAAGGIRTCEAALALLEAGASRLGTTATAAILGGVADGAGTDAY